MFDGLTSRWTLPAACSASSPLASCGRAERSRASSVATAATRMLIEGTRRNCIGGSSTELMRSSTSGSSTATPSASMGARGRTYGADRALDELHGEKPLVAVGDELPERDEVAVVDVLQRAKLALEAQQGLRAVPARAQALQGLEGDARVALAVEGLEDHAHAPLAQRAQQLEAVRDGDVHGRDQAGTGARVPGHQARPPTFPIVPCDCFVQATRRRAASF